MGKRGRFARGSNIRKDELKVLLATKLLEDGIVSIGKAFEIAGYSERAFVEILTNRGIAPIKYTDIDLDKKLQNA
ncbi:MAG: UPF0175 family protein [Pseudomonadota bacterium]